MAPRSLSRWLMRSLCLAAVLSAVSARAVSAELDLGDGSAVGLATSPPPIRKRVVSVNSLGFHLLQELSGPAAVSDENIFLSPVSVSTALAMAGVGATENSDSLRELEAAFGGMNLKGYEFRNKSGRIWHPIARMMEDALGSQWSDGSGVDVSVANGGWYKAAVREEYKDDIEDLFNATSAPLETGEKINDWVSGKTNGRITDLMSPGKVDAVAVLVSAIHFKGAWGTGFSKRRTRPGMTFHAPSGPVAVDMMWRELPMPGECFAVGFPACVERDNTIHTRYALGGGAPDVEVVEIGFGTSGDYSAVIMMPSESDRLADKDAKAVAEVHAAELDRLVRLLSQQPDLWGNITFQADQKLKERNEALSKGFKPLDGEVQILLPRFKVESKSDLVEPLRSLGIVTPFTQKEGQFLDISKETEVYIEDVSHVASLEVNEEGAEAAAATALILAPLSMSYPTVVRFDRPFLFFITSKKTGTVLFAGRVNNPESPNK